MNIPNLPVGKLVDKEGNLEGEWLHFFQELVSNLQSVIREEGIVVPSVTPSAVAAVAASGNLKIGTLLTELVSESQSRTLVAENDGAGGAILREIDLV